MAAKHIQNVIGTSRPLRKALSVLCKTRFACEQSSIPIHCSSKLKRLPSRCALHGTCLHWPDCVGPYQACSCMIVRVMKHICSTNCSSTTTVQHQDTARAPCMAVTARGAGRPLHNRTLVLRASAATLPYQKSTGDKRKRIQGSCLPCRCLGGARTRSSTPARRFGTLLCTLGPAHSRSGTHLRAQQPDMACPQTLCTSLSCMAAHLPGMVCG